MKKPDLVFQLIVQTKPRLAKLVLEVTNQSSQELAFDFLTGQEFDFVVTREGQEIWRWSRDMMFIQAFHKLVIKAGKTQFYKAGWDYKTLQGERVPSGDYVLQAYFLGVSRTEPAAQREFRVP